MADNNEHSDHPAKDEIEKIRKDYEARYQELFGSQNDVGKRVKDMLATDVDSLTLGLLSLAKNSPNENLRFQATKYILDRIAFAADSNQNELESFLEKMGLSASDNPNSAEKRKGSK